MSNSHVFLEIGLVFGPVRAVIAAESGFLAAFDPLVPLKRHFVLVGVPAGRAMKDGTAGLDA